MKQRDKEQGRLFVRRARAAGLVTLLVTLLAGCAGEPGRSASGAKEFPWQAITPQQSELSIAGPQDHDHRAHMIGARYQETVLFRNGARVWYEYLEGLRMSFGMTGGDVIKDWYGSPVAKEAGFVYKNAAVRRDSDSFSLTDSGASQTCSFYSRVFGVTLAGFSEGDQLYLIYACTRSSPIAAAATEHAVLAIAERLAGTSQFAKPVPTLSPTPPPEPRRGDQREATVPETRRAGQS